MPFQRFKLRGLRFVAHALLLLGTALFGAQFVAAQEAVSLVGGKDPGEGWSFNNGAEFPGATGSLTVDNTTSRDGRASLKLVGDFTKGGGYVQAGKKIDNLDIRELSLRVRNPGSNQFTLRINDGSGQTHQIVLKTDPSDDWQQITLPLEKFFARRGEADAVTSIAKYESWGGAKDGVWHGPATAIYLLLGNHGQNQVRTLWINDVSILSRPTPVAGAGVLLSVRLDEILEGTHDWRFSRGEEFPGAKGSLTVVQNEPTAGQTSLKLSGDFSGGGAYCAAIKSLAELDAKSIPAIRMQVKSDNASSIGIQMVDGSGQTHQRKGVKIAADGKWHELVIKPEEIAGGEHWGGANDAKWHGAGRQMVISVSPSSEEKGKQPTIYLTDVRADILQPVFAQPAAYKEDFSPKVNGKDWVKVGNTAFSAKNDSLVLSRSLDDVQKPCSATSPSFPAVAGLWEISLKCMADLNSPDNSYNAIAQLECLDSAGKVIDHITLLEMFGKREWQSEKKRIELPKAVATARFHFQLNKTHGKFVVDEIAAVYLTPAPRRDDRIARMLFSTAQLGNLLFPKDSRKVEVTVETRKPLRDSQKMLSYVVRDYWGAEQTSASTVPLGSGEKKGDRFVYSTSIDLSNASLKLGRYYELHAEISQEGEEPFRNYTSLAILPEAITRQYKPEEVPFTSRNWDNRLSEYVKLTDRLGVRICGIWGGWSATPPYKPDAPTLDLCQKLGMGWLTNTPIATIELGKKDYDETALREGIRNFLEKYGKIRPLIVNLGNEPHGKGDRVLANVAAYKVVYEEIKKIDPTIPVVATSVEPNEEYFKAGYGKWCDAYDFHIYEEYPNVRRTMEEYRALAKKYDVPKPIWSTELGLNSQGMTRHVVAVELIKKFSTFFAAGGTNVSWFGLLYPDGDGKLHGTSGNSHNVFDCRYNHYAPRLDAIAYYNAVNAIAIKKFVAEKEYASDVHAFLFRDRDDQSLQVIWKDKAWQDIAVPLEGVREVELIRIDGSRQTLDAGGKELTLTVSSDPVLLLYRGGPKTLPEALGVPHVKWSGVTPWEIARGKTFSVDVAVDGDVTSAPELSAPPFWTVERSQLPRKQGENAAFRFTLTPPSASTVREADLVVTWMDSQGRMPGILNHRCKIAE